MAQWLITVVTVAVLSVICDIILPEGQSRKFVSTVIGVVISFVLLQPVINLFVSDGINVSSNHIVADENYMQYLENMQLEQREKRLEEYLLNQNIDVLEVYFDQEDKVVSVMVKEDKTVQLQNTISAYLSVYAKGYSTNIIWGGD